MVDGGLLSRQQGVVKRQAFYAARRSYSSARWALITTADLGSSET